MFPEKRVENPLGTGGFYIEDAGMRRLRGGRLSSHVFLPDHARLLYVISGASWLLAFGLFLVEYAPMLTRVRRKIG